MRRTKIETEETRKAILSAALITFSKKGYDNTTLEEIADVANLTRGAVYWHFKNKEDLLNILLEEYEGSLLLRIQGFLKDRKLKKMSLSERALLWITLWVETMVSERNLFRTRAVYNIHYPERMSEKRKETNIQLMESVKAIFLPKLDEIKNPNREEALFFVIMVIDTSSAYKIILEEMHDHLLPGINSQMLICEYHQLFNSYLGLDHVSVKAGISTVKRDVK